MNVGQKMSLQRLSL